MHLIIGLNYLVTADEFAIVFAKVASVVKYLLAFPNNLEIELKAKGCHSTVGEKIESKKLKSITE